MCGDIDQYKQSCRVLNASAGNDAVQVRILRRRLVSPHRERTLQRRQIGISRLLEIARHRLQREQSVPLDVSQRRLVGGVAQERPPRLQSDAEVTAARIYPAPRERQRSHPEPRPVGLVGEGRDDIRLPGAGIPPRLNGRIGRDTELDHKAGNHAVQELIVEESGLDEVEEPSDARGGEGAVDGDREVAGGGGESDAVYFRLAHRRGEAVVGVLFAAAGVSTGLVVVEEIE
mmetsp:Transcript_28394/g.83512  ORF Transcript_28394/g.83512 Transcript_28394/m.83512 type:complete len:231 (+) Transcript_28394:369-1061(+)|eukprot:CAMPEP_0113591352 /NCGR_PEP_ID=MMETSP0015_2-20120614/37220_1 /TAXON_ID=2838 /ORGANISM="Odontella" /LENGTH=230 /DNA_ID=CAMNT_0000497721 /DNA_START=356 /DNA_END=1048 /DNA_ORIENTATION=+ /assembly_acc=CAM_ASM_000160